jgi:thymidylate synthase
MIRNDELHYIVYMRSNDAVFGLKNDLHWHKMIHADLLRDLLPTYPTLKLGDMHWNAGSLHVYERHFKLVEEFDE